MEPSKDEIRTTVLRLVAENEHRHSGHVRNKHLPPIEEKDWNLTISFLREGEFVIYSDGKVWLWRKGHDAIRAGGYIAYTQQQRDQHNLDVKVKEAAIKGHRWNKAGIIMTVIGTVLTIYNGWKADQQSERISEINQVLADTQQDREHAVKLLINAEVIIAKAQRMTDSLRMPTPDPS